MGLLPMPLGKPPINKGPINGGTLNEDDAFGAPINGDRREFMSQFSNGILLGNGNTRIDTIINNINLYFHGTITINPSISMIR